ncbi:hypothetical protein SLA2020_297320 [Shorea laevis]
MGGRGRLKKKDPPPNGGASKKTIGLKVDNGGRKSTGIAETIKEQAEVVKLVAQDLNQMGFEVEELGQLRPDLEDTEGDVEGTLLELASGGQVSDPGI